MAENELLPEVIQGQLKTLFVGQKILHFSQVDSTMDVARKEALWGAPAGTVIVAEQQTAGKGRLQRNWLSPAGGLALSVIFRPNLDNLPYMIMIASLAVAEAIRKTTGLKPQIKWPNDILIREKKISGILIENDIRKNDLKYCIVGIGVNVNIRVANFPEIATLATSLSDELKKQVSRLQILVALLSELDRLYQQLSRRSVIWEAWQKQLITIGQKVQVNMGGRTYTGTAESVTHDGSLLLRQKEGGVVRVIAGDVNLQ